MGVRRFCEEVAVRDRGATGTYFSYVNLAQLSIFETISEALTVKLC